MPQLARKLIDAIQNTLLDGLIFRLLNMLMASLAAARLSGVETAPDYAFLFLIPAFIGLIFMAWLLGFLANRSQPPATTPLARLHQPRRNGFEAWHDPPAGGLNPPVFFRRFVKVLSRANRWLAVPAWIGWIVGLLALVAPSWPSPEWRAMDGGVLDRYADLIFASVLALGLLLSFLMWASESNRRLTSASQTQASA
ncbi:hypothetical protein ACO2Q1_12345 [Brevundimonas sp. VNH65]|uniref:hypothetical protein n=1 Tax=Brevundimonas sp. VNH65 TaxID=3400917 RepID=UPI003BFD990A